MPSASRLSPVDLLTNSTGRTHQIRVHWSIWPPGGQGIRSRRAAAGCQASSVRREAFGTDLLRQVARRGTAWWHPIEAALEFRAEWPADLAPPLLGCDGSSDAAVLTKRGLFRFF
jgi:hypothetical protein